MEQRQSGWRWRTAASTFAIAVAGWSGAAFAQTATDAATPGEQPEVSNDDVGGLGEIVVTAQKRSESLQSTPLAITAITEDVIATRRIQDASDLNAVAPSLTVTTGPSSKGHLVVFIRGIGESEPILTADSPVGLYVDGVILGRSTGSVFELVDLERIEVLRGPQGTLYGRNTTGGAINLITRKPSNDFGFELLGSYGNLNYTQGRVSVNTGKLGNSGFKAKLSYIHRERQGYVDNINAPDEQDPGKYNVDAFRIALAYDQGAMFRGAYTYDWSDNRGNPPNNQVTAASANVVEYFSRSPSVGGNPFTQPSARRLDRASPDISTTFDRNTGHTLTLEFDIGADTLLRSISGYRTWRNEVANTDFDSSSGVRGLVVSPAPPGIRTIALFGGQNNRSQRQFSQELNLIGSFGDAFEYVVGGYFFTEKSRELNNQAFTFVTNIPRLGLAGVNITNQLAYRHKNESLAAFGQATYNFTDRLSFTGGLRYTRDEKRLDQTAPVPRNLKVSFDRINYAATLQYEATRDLMGYVRIASGYKAGGFNARAVNNGYDPETLTSYEVGVKSQFFDRRLRVNGALFYTDLKDKQLSQFLAGSGGAQTATVNAGSAEFKGFELEVEALPFEGLRLNGAVGYTDRKFNSFTFIDPITNAATDVADEAKFSYSASTTFNLGAEYTVPGDIAGGELSARLDYSYRSRVGFNTVPRFTSFDAAIQAPGFGLLDGRIQLADVALGDAEATFALWGRNLLNKVYRTSGVDFGSLGFATNGYGELRTYGIDARLRF